MKLPLPQKPIGIYFFRTLLLSAGGLIVGIAIGICSLSSFGADPITVFYEGLSSTLSITQGTASNITALVMILLVFIIDYHELGIGTILAPIFTSIGIDFILALPIPTLMPLARVLLLILGLIGIAFGIASQITANFGRGSYDALIISICNRFNKDYVLVRWILDGFLLATGLIMGGQLTIATVIAALFLGKIISFFKGQLNSVIPSKYLN